MSDLSEEAQKYIKALEEFSSNVIKYPKNPPCACHHCGDWIDEYDFFWRLFNDQLICEQCLCHLLGETDDKVSMRQLRKMLPQVGTL